MTFYGNTYYTYWNDSESLFLFFETTIDTQKRKGLVWIFPLFLLGSMVAENIVNLNFRD